MKKYVITLSALLFVFVASAKPLSNSLKSEKQKFLNVLDTGEVFSKRLAGQVADYNVGPELRCFDGEKILVKSIYVHGTTSRTINFIFSNTVVYTIRLQPGFNVVDLVMTPNYTLRIPEDDTKMYLSGVRYRSKTM